MFKESAFLNADLAPRTERVPVPELAAWFEDGDEAVWIIQSITADDYARATAARDNRLRETALAEALVSDRHADVKKELQTLLGHGDKVEPDTARRITLLCAGSAPACSKDVAIRLAKAFPVTFLNLTNKIMFLSGQGSEALKKPKPTTPATPS